MIERHDRQSIVLIYQNICKVIFLNLLQFKLSIHLAIRSGYINDFEVILKAKNFVFFCWFGELWSNSPISPFTKTKKTWFVNPTNDNIKLFIFQFICVLFQKILIDWITHTQILTLVISIQKRLETNQSCVNTTKSFAIITLYTLCIHNIC